MSPREQSSARLQTEFRDVTNDYFYFRVVTFVNRISLLRRPEIMDATDYPFESMVEIEEWFRAIGISLAPSLLAWRASDVSSPLGLGDLLSESS
jgi:hypothetical protein